VPDRFLLSDLGTGSRVAAGSLAGRVLAVLAAVGSSPLVLLGAVRNLGAGTPLFVRREAVRSGHTAARPLPSLPYRELGGFQGLARRWPQLWSVARGDFAWVGNRPLTPAEAADLSTDYEKLWLATPPGVFSLADALGCQDPFGDEARAHASFFAVDPTPRKHLRVLGQILRRVFVGAPKARS
jgi:hypothetical protein